MQLEEVTTVDVQAYLEEKRLVIIPFGSTEQHGPHLPIGTDTYIAEAIAREAGTRTNTMVAPVIPIGFSPGLHPHFAGTITLDAVTYVQVVQDILRSLFNSGFTDFLLLTGHGLNYSPLKAALLNFLNTCNASALLTGYWEFSEVQPLLEPGDGVHCTILETSIMLHLKGELVDMSKGLDEYKKQRFLLGSDYMKEISKSGIIAETTKATSEKGERYFTAAVEGLVRVLDSFQDPGLYD